MPRLTPPQKQYLVCSLARFHTPTEAAAAFGEQFGVTISRQAAARYDPRCATGGELSEALTALFWESRKKAEETRKKEEEEESAAFWDAYRRARPWLQREGMQG
jgi:hypothetical protein